MPGWGRERQAEALALRLIRASWPVCRGAEVQASALLSPAGAAWEVFPTGTFPGPGTHVRDERVSKIPLMGGVLWVQQGCLVCVPGSACWLCNWAHQPPCAPVLFIA